MTASTRPLSYEASKCVLQYLPANQRLHIRLRCPALRTADSIVPLKINILGIYNSSLRIDQVWYHFTGRSYLIECPPTISDNNVAPTSGYFSKVVLDADRSLGARRSFLTHKVLGGRRAPVVLDTLDLQTVYRKDLDFPNDVKIKLNHLKVQHLTAQLLQQLTRHVVGEPLRSITTLFIEGVKESAFKSELFINARKVVIDMYVLRFEYLDDLCAIREKEVFVTKSDGEPTNEVIVIMTVIRNRRTTHLNAKSYMTINTVQSCKDTVFNRLLAQPGARQGVVDDVENSQFNIPCVCLPMGPINELNIYGIPGRRNEIDLKIVVGPKGSARINE